MPVIYASTKKGRLESWLKKQPSWMTKAKIRQNFCADTGIEISSSSVSTAIEEWQMNNYVTQQSDQFRWTWNRGDGRKRGTTTMAKLPDEVAAYARRLGGDLPLEDNRALFVRRVCKQLACTEDQLRGLGVSEKMALIALLSQSVLDSNAN